MKQPIELPVGSMVVGDSFFVPCVDTHEVSHEAHRLARQYKFKLRIEKVVYNSLYGIRIWRTE
jgi:hypothetical protein